jgi:hypothetical protein
MKEHHISIFPLDDQVGREAYRVHEGNDHEPKDMDKAMPKDEIDN